MTTDLPEAPAYFSRDVRLNREGPGRSRGAAGAAGAFAGRRGGASEAGAVLLDTRAAAEYGTGHVAGSLQIGRPASSRRGPARCSAAATPIVLVAEDEERVAEARTRLARVGLENVAGYLAGGIRAWDAAGRPLARTEQIAVDELRARLARRRLQLVDVRRPAEWQTGHIPQAGRVPLHELSARAGSLDRERPVAAICAGGYRSSIATSAARAARVRASPTSSAAWPPGPGRGTKCETKAGGGMKKAIVAAAVSLLASRHGIGEEQRSRPASGSRGSRRGAADRRRRRTRSSASPRTTRATSTWRGSG